MRDRSKVPAAYLAVSWYFASTQPGFIFPLESGPDSPHIVKCRIMMTHQKLSVSATLYSAIILQTDTRHAFHDGVSDRAAHLFEIDIPPSGAKSFRVSPTFTDLRRKTQLLGDERTFLSLR